MSDAPVFIVGCDRSGTTLLRLMLNAHSRIAVPYESHFLLSLFKKGIASRDIEEGELAGEVFGTITSTWHMLLWELAEEELWERMRSSIPQLAQLVSVPFEMYAESEGKVRWGDKTPAYVTCMPELRALFLRAQFIHAVRDGRDVAASMKTSPRYRGNAVTWADLWKRRVEAGRRDGQGLGEQYMEVSYERLVYEPESSLRRICAYLGESFEPEMLRYYESSERYIPDQLVNRSAQFFMKRVTPSRIGRWQTELTQREIELFEAVAGETLEKFGYKLTGVPKSGALLQFVLFSMRAPVFIRRKLNALVKTIPAVRRRSPG